MLTVILNVLCFVGITFLIILGILIFFLILVLFFPIRYRFSGQKNDSLVSASFKMNWLFGILNATYYYPKPGKFVIKVLWFSLYDISKTKTHNSVFKKKKGKKKKFSDNHTKEDGRKKVSNQTLHDDKISDSNLREKNDVNESKNKDSTDQEYFTKHNTKVSLYDKLLQKYEKLKYTIHEIYVKIKHISEDYIFYKDLFDEQENKLLLAHVFSRIGNILKSIRPKHFQVECEYGTGSPDSTGYLYGVYGMLISILGEHVCVRPNFENLVLNGTINASGRITIFTLLLNAFILYRDERLWKLIKKIKQHNHCSK